MTLNLFVASRVALWVPPENLGDETVEQAYRLIKEAGLEVANIVYSRGCDVLTARTDLGHEFEGISAIENLCDITRRVNARKEYSQ